VTRILVSGVGRSATTLIYRQIGRGLQARGLATQYSYEPYLWNIRALEMKGQSFGQADLNHFGLAAHLETPLFQPGPGDALHDAFLARLFEARAEDQPALPGAFLAKVIRGAGRLRAGLGRYDDLKVVACLRNPIDTINSSLGMFSFFGEDYHADDRARFRAELLAGGAHGARAARWGVDAAALPEGRSSVEWAAAWVAAFTAEQLAVAEEFPGRVHLITHEEITADPEAAITRLAAFLDLPVAGGMALGLGRAAGPRGAAVNLTVADLDRLLPHAERYGREVLAPRQGAQAAAALLEAQKARFGNGRYQLPLAGADARHMGTGLHEFLLAGEETPFVKLMRRPPHPTALAALAAAGDRPAGEEAADAQAAASAPMPLLWPTGSAAALKAGRSFGVVIICFNSGLLTADAVLSCLAQTLPFDEIVVVDDCSTDDSAEILAELEARFAQVRLIRLPVNLGPAAARHIGITRLGTDFVTQLDGDDLFWPGKLEGEARVLAGDLGRVAFSDTLSAAAPDDTERLDTSAYDGGGSSAEAVFAQLLERAPYIPRDLTLARADYFAAGGYDLTADLFEDWEFKLRLAALPGRSWHRAPQAPGTVYNQSAPGLSGTDLDHHARRLITVFLRSLDLVELPPPRVLAAFDAALFRVRKRPPVRAARAWLARLIDTGSFDAGAVAGFGRARWLYAQSDAAFAALLARLGETGAPPPAGPAHPAAARPALHSSAGEGFDPWQGPEPPPSPGALVALSGRGMLEVTLSLPVTGFGLWLAPGDAARRLRVRAPEGQHRQLLAGAEPGTEPGAGTGGPGLCHVHVPLSLPQGRSRIVIEAKPERAAQAGPLVLGGLYLPEAG